MLVDVVEEEEEGEEEEEEALQRYQLRPNWQIRRASVEIQQAL